MKGGFRGRKVRRSLACDKCGGEFSVSARVDALGISVSPAFSVCPNCRDKPAPGVTNEPVPQTVSVETVAEMLGCDVAFTKGIARRNFPGVEAFTLAQVDRFFDVVGEG